MNQNGDIIVEILTIMDHSLILVMERLVHILLSKKMFNLIQNTNLSGDIILETLTTMVLSLILLSAKLVHTQ